jgi:uncharacterized membrane protein SirB2
MAQNAATPARVTRTFVDYPFIKLVHQLLVGLTVAGFAARSAGRLAGAEWVGSRAARTLPHLVDSLLLLSGVWMLWLLRTSPHQLPWLAAKLVGLLVYVGLGVVALREGTPRRTRWAATVLALCTVAWMVSVARAKHPLGGWVGLL